MKINVLGKGSNWFFFGKSSVSMLYSHAACKFEYMCVHRSPPPSLSPSVCVCGAPRSCVWQLQAQPLINRRAHVQSSSMKSLDADCKKSGSGTPMSDAPFALSTAAAIAVDKAAASNLALFGKFVGGGNKVAAGAFQAELPTARNNVSHAALLAILDSLPLLLPFPLLLLSRSLGGGSVACTCAAL